MEWFLQYGSRRICLLDLNNCDAGVRICDTLYNSMAYVDDITLFATNVPDLQNLTDVQYLLYTVTGGDSNMRLKSRNAGLLGNVRCTTNQNGCLVANVCLTNTRILYLVTCLLVVVIMPVMSPTD